MSGEAVERLVPRPRTAASATCAATMNDLGDACDRVHTFIHRYGVRLTLH